MKYILFIVLLLISLTVYFIVQPDPVYEVGKTAPSNGEVDDGVEPVTTVEETAAVERRKEMQSVYKQLEKARRNLERRLSRLKALLWDVELPREESDRITAQMKNAYTLLKNKKLLGAFSGIRELREELSRVVFAYENLEPIERMARNREEQGDRPANLD